MNLVQQRILQTLEEQGSVPIRELGKWLKDVDHVQLDVNVGALMREQRVTQSMGRYEIGPVKKAPPGRRAVAMAVASPCTDASPPTAAEEAAANLKPLTRVCDRCHNEKQLNAENFSRNRHGLMKICKVCYGAAVAAGGKGKRSAVVMSEVSLVTVKVPAEVVEEAKTGSIVIANSVLDRVRAQRQDALNRIALYRVDITNLESKVAECDQFLGLYERFAEGAE